MKARYGIEIKNRETGLWQPSNEDLYECRRTAALQMIELNRRSEGMGHGQMFRVTVIENAD